MPLHRSWFVLQHGSYVLLIASPLTARGPTRFDQAIRSQRRNVSGEIASNSAASGGLSDLLMI